MTSGAEFRDLVERARSTRRFVEADAVPPEVVRDLVDLARVTPCGGNQQPLRYRIVTEPDECWRVFPHTKWAGALKDWDGPAPGERPSAYIAILSRAGSNPATTLGIAAQTIQLGATAAGYAACMLGAIDREAIAVELGIDPAWSLLLLVALGRPAERIVLEPAPATESTTYWRTPDGVHHVPKLGLEDVLV